MMFFLLFVMLIAVLFGDSIKVYITNDINGATKEKVVVDISDIGERYFYFRIAMFCRSSVQELNDVINDKIYYYI